MSEELNLIAESRRLCAELTGRLPSDFVLTDDAWFISSSGRKVASKIPSRVMAVIGTLAHRARDFGELSCELFERNKVIPAIVLTRALMETTALLYLTQKKMSQALKTKSLDQLDDFLVKCLSGNRIDPAEPESPNVLTAIQHLDKENGCERYADFYNSLCEFAHPNSLGTFYAYTEFDPHKLKLSFGENKGLTKAEDAAFSTVFALEVIIEFYDKAVAAIPDLKDLSEKLFDDTTAA